jgi:hypothetical protein
VNQVVGKTKEQRDHSEGGQQLEVQIEQKYECIEQNCQNEEQRESEQNFRITAKDLVSDIESVQEQDHRES